MSKVSIIIPIYNVEKFLNRTIDSVINQTEFDIEIILVDDGSEDKSGCICDTYAERDKRIRVIHKENGGLSSARNAGTNVATSDYVMYLDGDDYLREDAVSKLLEVVKQYPSDFVQYRYQEVGVREEPIKQVESGDVYQVCTAKELFENLYRIGGTAASGATKLLRRELMLRIPFMSICHEDEMWCTQAFQNDLKVTFIPDKLYYYVIREGSIIHSSFDCKRLDIFDVSKERIRVLINLGLQNLLPCEYGRFFLAIVDLYVKAKLANDVENQQKILQIFQENKSAIAKYAKLSPKLSLLLLLMKMNENSINLYSLYVKWRK